MSKRKAIAQVIGSVIALLVYLLIGAKAIGLIDWSWKSVLAIPWIMMVASNIISIVKYSAHLYLAIKLDKEWKRVKQE